MRRDEAFLRAVLEDPADDAPRLIYADWLEEQGNPRGEFIRVQCAVEKRRAGLAGPVSDESPWLQNDRTYQALRRRERELLKAHRKEWTMALAPAGWRYWQTATEQGWAGPNAVAGKHDLALHSVAVAFRRGFVYQVSLASDAVISHAGDLLRLYPLERIDLHATDDTPAPTVWIEPGPQPGQWHTAYGTEPDQRNSHGRTWRSRQEMVDGVGAWIAEQLETERAMLHLPRNWEPEYERAMEEVRRQIVRSLRILGVTPLHRNTKDDMS